MTRTSVPAARLLVAATVALVLFPACGGSQGGAPGGAGSGAQIGPLELQPVGPDPRPFGLLTSQVISWRTSAAGTYQVTLRPGGVQAAEEVLASGSAAAGQVIAVTVRGYELTAGADSALTFSVLDSAGRFETITRELELLPIDELQLGSGLYSDLVYDATRDELLLTNRLAGYVKILDVDPVSPGYGQEVALLPPGPDAGPWRVTTTPDGDRGFNLYRTTMIEYDLQSLEIDNNLYLSGGFEPSGIAPTPDSTRVYIGYYHTLIFYDATPSGVPPQVEGTGIEDSLVLGGNVAITPDGSYAFYAWYGVYNAGLWIVDVDPLSPEFHTLLSERSMPFTPVPSLGVPVTPKVAITPSGGAAYVGAPMGISKFEVQPPEFPLVAARPEAILSGLATSRANGEDRVLSWEPFGSLTVYDDQLEVLGTVQLPGLLVEQAAVDQEGGRLFLVSQQQQTAGRVLVVPLR